MPEDPESYNDLAIALFQSGDVDGAIAMLEELLRLFPSHSDGYFGLGMALEQKREYARALKCYRKAYELSGIPQYLDMCARVEAAIKALSE